MVAHTFYHTIADYESAMTKVSDSLSDNGDLKVIVLDAARSLGYDSLKEEQEAALTYSYTGSMCSCPYQQDTGKVYATLHFQ